VTSVIFLSIGQTSRWDILDHVQMADRYETFGTFYPEINDKYYTGTSVYFPGLSLMTLLIKNIFPDSLIIYILQAIACTMIIIFYFIQKFITNTFVDKISPQFYFFATSIYFVYLNYDWLIYASEFKPDIISFNIGALGVILSKINNKQSRNIFLLIIGAFLTGIAIIFKQQFVFFLFGLFVYAVIKKDLYTRMYVLITILISTTVLFFLKNSNIWFWTVTVLSDDGFLNIKEWLFNYYTMAKWYLFFLMLILILIHFKLFSFPEIKLTSLNSSIFNNVWTYIIFFVFVGAVVSSFKVGGNAGNTAFGLVTMTPLFIYLFKQLDKKHLFILFVVLVFPRMINMAHSGIEKYKKSNQLTLQVKKGIKEKNIRILTGSDVYSATRNVRDSNFIINYWTYSLKKNTDMSDELKRLLDSVKFNYIIIENNDQNIKILQNFKLYDIKYINDIGIFAAHK
jgi:hypothetical protein